MSDFFARRRSSGDSFIISHPVRFVKRFFKSFLNFFLFLSTVPVVIVTVLSATSLLYHFRDLLSSGFLNFFSSFFVTSRPQSLSSAVSSTAPLLYHFFSPMSIPFFNLFRVFSYFICIFVFSFFSSMYIELSFILYYNRTCFLSPRRGVNQNVQRRL